MQSKLELSECKGYQLPELDWEDFDQLWGLLAEIEGRFPRLNLVLQFLRERSPNPEETAMIENLVKSMKKDFDGALSELRESLELAHRKFVALGYSGESIKMDLMPKFAKVVGILNSAINEICSLLFVFDKWTQAKIEQAKYQRQVMVR